MAFLIQGIVQCVGDASTYEHSGLPSAPHLARPTTRRRRAMKWRTQREKQTCVREIFSPKWILHDARWLWARRPDN